MLLPKEDSNRPLYREWANEASTAMRAINFGIKAGNSVGYVELFGMQKDTIYTMSTDNEKLEIDWADKEDADVVAGVAGYKKHFGKLTDDTQEFITEYDFIEYMAEILPGFEGKVRVTGTVEKQPYITKDGAKVFMDRYLIQNIYAAGANDKPGLKLNMELFYNGECVDESEKDSERIITVDGYVAQYVGKGKGNAGYLREVGKNLYIPQRVVLNGGKLDMDNPKHVTLWEARLDELCGLSDKKMYHMTWECALQNGPEEVEFDEDQLTDKQRRLIECGAKTLNDFKPAGAVYGSTVRNVALICPELTGSFADGVEELESTLTEFEESIAQFNNVESLDDIIADSQDGTTVEEDEDDAAAGLVQIRAPTPQK